MYRVIFIFLSLLLFSCSGTYHDYIKKGIAAQKDKNYEKAIGYYTKSIKLKEKNQIAYNNRGLCYRKLHMPDKALADFKKAVKHYALYSDAYNNIGQIYMDRKEYQKAAEYFEQSVKADDQFFVGYYNLACAYTMLNKKPEALSYLETSANIILKSGKKAKKFYNHMIHDKQLAGIRTERRFVKILKDLKEFF